MGTFRVDYDDKGDVIRTVGLDHTAGMTATIQNAPNEIPEGAIVLHKHNDPIVIVKVELLEMPYPTWRRFGIQSCANFVDLHLAIQAAMGWWDTHLWGFFDKTNACISNNDQDGCLLGDRFFEAEDQILGECFERGTKRFRYHYDFGDNWVHRVTFEKMQPGDKTIPWYPAILNYKGRCPPEDIGGVDGFADFLTSMRQPGTERFRHACKWYGGKFDKDAVEFQMAAYRLVPLAQKLQLSREAVAAPIPFTND